MSLIWIYFSIIIIVLVTINCFGQGYYGNKATEKTWLKVISGSIQLSIFAIIYGAFVVIIYYFAGILNFSVPYYVNLPNMISLSFEQKTILIGVSKYTRAYTVNTALILCCLAPLVLLAAICYSIFAGLGMSMFPIQLILSFFSQPTKPNAEEYVLAKKILLKSSERIITKIRDAYDLRRDLDLNPITNPVEKKMKIDILNKSVAEMKTELSDFDEVFLVFKAQDNIIDNNPLVYLAYLIMGILFFLISILFVIHTFLCIKGSTIILDSFFNFIASAASLLALIVFIIISVYIGLAIIYGAIKFSGILGSFLGILPFKLNATWIDAFLLNNQILILSLLGMIQYFASFCPNFLRFISAQIIFTQVISHITLLNPIFTYAIPEYLYLFFFLVGVVLLLFQKSPKAILDEKIKEEQVKIEAEKERIKEMEGAKDDKKEEPKK